MCLQWLLNWCDDDLLGRNARAPATSASEYPEKVFSRPTSPEACAVDICLFNDLRPSGILSPSSGWYSP